MISIEEIKQILGPNFTELTEEEYVQLRSDAYGVVNYLIKEKPP